MKFVWVGGVLSDRPVGCLPRPRWSWQQLFLDNWRQRRAERREKARRDADGVAYPTEWWK